MLQAQDFSFRFSNIVSQVYHIDSLKIACCDILLFIQFYTLVFPEE